MPLLRLNAAPSGLTLHDTPQPVMRRLRTLAAEPGPAIVMLHGYKYAPGSADHCPHAKIFGTAAQGWPAQLGFGAGRADEGLGIALGWYARGALREAHARAADLGESLAVIVAMLRAHRPDRPVHVIAHSLGAEMALSSLAHLPAGAIGRMVLLTGASHAGRAQALLDTPAGRSVEVLNVTSRENDLFDAGFERLIRPALPGDRALGAGIAAPNVVSLQLDCPRSLEVLRHLGYAVAAPQRRVCHWSAYRRAGVMAFYDAFLRRPESLPLARLAGLLPSRPAPRWSRLLVMPRPARKLLPRVLAPLGSVSPAMGAVLPRRPQNEPAC